VSAADRPPADTLELLALFHYAVGALAGMLSLVPALFLFVNISLTDPAVEATVRTQAQSALHGAAVAGAVGALVAGLLLGALLVWAGRCLADRRRWGLCRAAAILSCLFVPIGTILGLVTLSMISRPDVRAEFA
jgi:hypothetical protein